MIKVRLLAETNVPPIELTKHAAMTCYRSVTPELAKIIAGEYQKVPEFEELFENGHHTTLEHTSFTFEIDGISVGDVDFGLHLTSPFYNSDQRSGRYAKMFEDPNAVDGVIDAILEVYPDLETSSVDAIRNYVGYCLSVYHDNQDLATKVCGQLHEQERPHLTEDLRKKMPKLAQEQLRAFIPIIVPTGLDYTIDLITLAGSYHSAWSPGTRKLTELMVAEVLAVHPELELMFGERQGTLGDFAPKFVTRGTKLIGGPKLTLVSIEAPLGVKVPTRRDKHPLDLTTIHPGFMDNEVGTYLAKVECTLMTYGQDQRHRSNRRSQPVLTGNFLLSPMLTKLGLGAEAKHVMRLLRALEGLVPDSLLVVLAPYGATIRYMKRGSLNALIHESGKRLCFCAQGEIYELMRQLRLQLEAKPKWGAFLPLVEPPCMNGPCAEPGRYCGRDMTRKDDYFPPRSV